MTTPTKRVVKTPGQIDYELWWAAVGNTGSAEDGWKQTEQCFKDNWERHAASLPTPIEPLTEDVPEPPKTDGELMLQATDNCSGHVFLTSEADDIAAEFLRLLRERDGDVAKSEPLEVTADDIRLWLYEGGRCSIASKEQYVAKLVNAHRGVRSVPQVTAEMWEDADDVWFSQVGKTIKERASIAANYLNAELAKQAGKVGG